MKSQKSSSVHAKSIINAGRVSSLKVKSAIKAGLVGTVNHNVRLVRAH
jgi:hypothetical protein